MAGDPHRIALDDAVTLVHRAQSERLLAVDGWSFGASIVREILHQPGVEGLRIYLARQDTGEPTVVLVGVDGKGSDVAAGTLAEEAWPCPPLCDRSSPFHRTG